MAMKTRTSTSLRPVYEYFEPPTELSENQDAHFLQIHLPAGFTRDQINITFVSLTRMLNVSGERAVDNKNYRWVRFNQSYPIPQNCEEGRLQANFNQGVLIITMPKKLVSQPSPQIEAQQKSPLHSKKQEPRPARKAQEGIYGSEKSRPEKAQEKLPREYTPRQVEDSKPMKTYEHIPQGLAPGKMEEQNPEKAQEEIPQKFRIRRGKEDLAQNLEDERRLKALTSSETIKESMFEKDQDEVDSTQKIVKARKPIDEKLPMDPLEKDQRPMLKITPKKPKDEKQSSEEIEEQRETKKEEEEGGKLPRKPEKMFQEKEITTRKKTPETEGKEKERITRKEDLVDTIGKGFKQVSASTSQVVTKISERKWNDEEKPMLINMGAAMLVIAALGVYVSYKMASCNST